MIRWSLLDSAVAPGGGDLRLMRRGQEFSITIDGGELMNSRRGGSEARMATLAAERLHGVEAPHVLIGGLGMGFTLRAALTAFGPQAEITVAEISPAVVDWAKGPLRDLFGSALSDPRVGMRTVDVADLMIGAAYDAILLDVDNGPAGLVRSDNDRLYSLRGLHACRCALRPGGVLAIWSAAPDASFVARLLKEGFKVTEVLAHAHGDRGPRHVIWIAA